MVFCRGGCGTKLLDDSIRSQSGKLMPLEDDGSAHDCPNRYDPGTENGVGKDIKKMVSKIMLDVQFIWMKLEGQKTLDDT